MTDKGVEDRMAAVKKRLDGHRVVENVEKIRQKEVQRRELFEYKLRESDSKCDELGHANKKLDGVNSELSKTREALEAVVKKTTDQRQCANR